MVRSVLDDLGQEVTGIAAPVSICMAITVLLVRLLNPKGESNSGVTLASIYYSEDTGDSTGTKLSGSVINAIIFVSIIAAMTFLLVLLFKYGCTKLIYAYLGFSVFSIFFVLTGVIIIELLQKAHAHMDWISFAYILFNFAVVGSVTLFFAPAPLLLQQCYLIVTGFATAFVFTFIPEWTTWVLLVAMALYDIAAVLVPGGPLQQLVELAQERDEDIPALVYQARPVLTRRTPREINEEGNQRVEEVNRDSPPPPPMPFSSLVPLGNADSHDNTGIRALPHQEMVSSAIEDCPSTPLIRNSMYGGGGNNNDGNSDDHRNNTLPSSSTTAVIENNSPINMHHATENAVFSLPEAIKLGLGDFIFYSVLLGRAAMYDMLTVFACYFAIMFGLGCTLMWLALSHRALPALPLSIALAVVFYFVSRFVMEPVILPMTLHLVYF